MKEPIEITADLLAYKLEPGEYLFILNRNVIDGARFFDRLLEAAPIGVGGPIIVVDGPPAQAIAIMTKEEFEEAYHAFQ